MAPAAVPFPGVPPPRRGGRLRFRAELARRPAGRVWVQTLGVRFSPLHRHPPPPPVSLDQWHVAINDVPVGPVRRAEIKRKVATGAVRSDSLCWREGFDDWRPLKDVPELAALLRQPPPAPPKPVSLGRGIQRSGSRPRIRMGSRSSMPAASPGRSTGTSNVVPIGGRYGAAAAPAVEPEYEEGVAENTAVSDPPFGVQPPGDYGGAPALRESQPPGMGPDPFAARPSDPDFGYAGGGRLSSAPSYPAAPARRRRGLPVGAWIGVAGAIAFGITLAAMVGYRFLFEDSPDPDAPAVAAAPEQVTPAAAEVAIDETVPEDLLVEPEEEEVAVEAAGDAPRAARRPSSGRAASRDSAMDQLSAADRERLRRMSEGGTAPNLRGLGGGFDDGRSSRARSELSAEQVSAVVGRNRASLRSCYERAIRGRGDPPSVRVDVNLNISPSGRVSQVRARASTALGGLTECVEGNVRRWVFPRSGNGAPLNFPVMFSGGG